MHNKTMKKIFYIFSFILSALIFSAILPYPILSNHTNISENVAYNINNFQETEVSKSGKQYPKIMKLDFQVMDNLLPLESKFEIFDLQTKLKFSCLRIGGTFHFDILPTTQQDAQIIFEIADENWSWQRRAVLVKINDFAYVPASLCTYPHGYGTTTYFNGHLCLHFFGSKMDGTKQEDWQHQKHISIAQAQGQAFLETIEDLA